jgi:hypothetical protein
MSRRITWAVAALAALGLALSQAAAQPAAQPGEKKEPENVQKAKEKLTETLGKLKAEGGQVVWLHSPALAQAFPKDVFFAVRFRQFPVARRLPEGMAASNVFVVPENGEARRLPNDKELRTFFEKNLGAVKEEKAAKDAVGAWLTLAPEFVQDGFYKFEVTKETEVEKSDGGLSANGRAMVMQGGNGQVSVKLVFNGEGKLSGAEPEAKVRPGPRPICQATKLLDPDPIVRRMAEQDLLCMGRAAGDYLREQRGRAAPELRQAIDRIWQRILEQD